MKRYLVKDSGLGWIVKDEKTNSQCVYGKGEARAKTAYLHGIGKSEYETINTEILVPINNKTNILLSKDI